MHALVVALNPSVDVEWRVGRVRWEEPDGEQDRAGQAAKCNRTASRAVGPSASG